MRIIDRYILKYFIPSFLWCLVMFLFLYVIIDFFGHIDEIIRERVPFTMLAYYYLTFVPLIFVQTSTIAMLLANIYNLSKHNRHNEIVAMKAGGINIWSALRPILFIGLLVSVLVFLVGDKVASKSARISAGIKEELIDKKKRPEKRIMHNVAVYGSKNRIIYARTFDARENKLRDIVVHEHDRRQNLTRKISAPEATFLKGSWLFSNALISRLDNQGKLIGDPEFRKKVTIDIAESPSDFAKRAWRAEFMSYKELKKYVRLFEGGARNTLNRLRVELYYKISFPLTSLIIVLIGAPFALQIKRGGALAGIGVGIIISLIYYAFSAIAMALGKARVLPPLVAAWLGNIVFGVFGFIRIQKLR